MSSDRSNPRFHFLVLCVVGAFAILSSTMSKNPVLNPFAESLGTPEAFMGFVAAASTIPGILISIPAGSLSDVLGRKKVLLASCVVFASAPFLYTVISFWWQLIIVRFYHGFATAIFVPVARAAIAEYYPSKRAERISTFTSATIVGRSIAPFLGGFVLAITFWDYHKLYLTVGVAGVTTLFTALVLMREEDSKPNMQSPNLPSERSRQNVKLEPTSTWSEVLGNSRIMTVAGVDAATYYVYGAVEFFIIGYLKNVALLDASLIGIITGMQIALIPIVSPFMGRVSDRVGREVPIVTGLVISGLPLLAIPYTSQFLPILAISVIYGLGFSLVTSSTPALVGDLTGKGSYGVSMGLLATIMDIGQTLGPILTGIILASFGYQGSFTSLAAILWGFCAFFAMFRRLFSS